MIMRAIAIEHWSAAKEQRVITWLKNTFGPRSMDSWFIDQDYDLISLCMTDEIYTLYKLKWG